jgi:carboxyl-terminal processing protease
MYDTRNHLTERSVRVKGKPFRNFIRMSQLCLLMTLAYSVVVNAQETSHDQLSDSTALMYKNVVSTMKEHALNNTNVDWDAYNRKAEHILSTGGKREDVFQLLGSIFTDIGDFHGGFFYDGVRYGMRQPDLNVRQELQDGFRIGAKVKSLILDGQFGYIFIPPINSFASDGGKSVGLKIDSIICHSPNVKGWIVDLRLNLGGNMYPMIGGLQSLLGEGKMGAFVSKNQETTEWTISKGVFKAGLDSVTIANSLCDFKTLPVVVLISQLTSSSGEAVAIAFKGRDKTIFLGEPTSGYITALNRYQLDSHAMLLVAEAYMCDRTGFCYTKKLTPDIILVHGDNFMELENDVKVLQALSWLKRSR